MSEVWFNALDGHLLIGAEAYEKVIEQTGLGDLVPLQNMLTSQSLPVRPSDYEKQPHQEWTPDEYLALGASVFCMLRQADPEASLEREHLDRLYQIGIAPKARIFIGKDKPFSSINALRRQFGAPDIYRPMGLFDDWTLDDYVRHAMRVERAAGRKPNEADYDAYAATHPDTPPAAKITLAVPGNLSGLNEHLGYPNIKSWDEDDYIAFGVKLIEANDISALGKISFDILSAAKRGPGYSSIFVKFGNWNNYRSRVLEEFEAQSQAKEEERLSKLKLYHKLIAAGDMPGDYKDLDEETLLVTAGRHLVMAELYPELTTNRRKLAVEALTAQGFVGHLIRFDPSGRTTAGDVEVTAAMLGVYDDIWPMDSYKEYLKITPEQLQDLRAARASHARQNRKSRSKKLLNEA